MNVSAIIPALNEERNIEITLRRLHKALLSTAEKFEIIVVDDGSTDGTGDVVGNLMEKYDSLKIIRHNKNEGYGFALRAGIAAAMYEWLFIMDSDNQFDPEELSMMTGGAEMENDALIGYRKNRQDSFSRRISSKVYIILIRYLFGLKFRDINCAFKLLKRSVVLPLNIKSRYYVINTEILFKLSMSNHKIKEFPVTHYPRQHGRSKVALKDILRTLSELRLLKSEKM